MLKFGSVLGSAFTFSAFGLCLRSICLRMSWVVIKPCPHVGHLLGKSSFDEWVRKWRFQVCWYFKDCSLEHTLQNTDTRTYGFSKLSRNFNALRPLAFFGEFCVQENRRVNELVRGTPNIREHCHRNVSYKTTPHSFKSPKNEHTKKVKNINHLLWY